MSVKLLTEQDLEFLSLKGGCIGTSESTLVKKPHCWKLDVTAHVFVFFRSEMALLVRSRISNHVSFN